MMKRVAILTPLLTLICSVCFAGANRNELVSTNETAVAVVMGRTIGVSQKHEAMITIFNMMLEKCCRDNKLTLAETEIDAYVQSMRRKELEVVRDTEADRKALLEAIASPVLSVEAKERKQVELKQVEDLLGKARELTDRSKVSAAEITMERRRAAERVLKWKINRELYRKYGGRVITFGGDPESFDGKREYFMEQEEAGAFKILDKEVAARFWNILTNEAIYARMFVPEKESGKAIETPWWLEGGQAASTNAPAAK